MLLTFLLGFGANMISHITPVAETVHFDRLEQQQLLVSTPLLLEDGNGNMILSTKRVDETNANVE
jgi:hypothetical protein